MSSRLELSANSDWEIGAQRRSIERRLAAGEDELLVMLIPEGTLFCNSLYGFSLVSQAVSLPENDPFRSHALSKIEWLLDRMDRLRKRHPFDVNTGINPKGGIIIVGHTNLLRAGYVLLGGTKKEIRDAYDVDSRAIYDAFMNGKTPFPECYPGYTWAQDSIFALESLRLHDVLFGTKYDGARQRWLSAVKEHIDPESGLMVAQIEPSTGASVDGARGCAVAWGLAYMPQFDDEFSRSQYQKFRQNWFVNFLGCSGVHEWYRGVTTPTNFHAGPVILNMGMAASGISMAACRSNNDAVGGNRLLRSLEFLGCPMVTPNGEKSYILGLCLVADVVSVWGKTITRWDAAPAQNVVEVAASDQTPFDDYRYAIAIASLISFLIIFLLGRNCYRTFLNKSNFKVEWRTATKVGFGLQLVMVLTFFVTAYFSWMQIVVFMALIDMLEEMSVRPSIVATLFRDAEAKTSDP